ncbi:MAG: tetratricopeptide repeat protein, partial [Rhodospirillales bacterium]|nr:tetratricopeptide repeat protein [Rhodospirillales bacterium]
ASSYQKSLNLKPDYAMAHNNLGNTLLELGRLDEAIASLHKALIENPDFVVAHNNLGNALKALGKLDQAVDSYQRALSLKPDYAEAHNNLGNALTKQGRLDEAVASYHTALSLKPDLADAHNNLSTALKDLGRLDEAVASCQKALSLHPDYAEAHSTLGNALRELGKPDEAAGCYQKAITLKPDFAEAHNNLGNTFQELGNLDEAITCYHDALTIKPDYAEAHSNLELAYREQGKVDEAAKQIDLALSFKPENAGWLIRKALLLPIVPSSQEEIQRHRETLQKAIQDLLKQNLTLENPSVEVGVTNFYLAYHNQNNREIQEDIARLYAAACPSLTYEAEHCRPEGRKDRDKKDILRIGILSTFLFDHTIGLLTRGFIQHLSRDRFEVILFRPPRKKDKISEAMEQTADKVVPLSGNLKRDHHTIEAERLDILFYPDIGMSHYPYCLAFARLAPIQAVTWGHPDTTGIPNVDYFISSELLEISDPLDHYSERLIKLRNVPTYYIYPDLPETKYPAGDFGLPEDIRLYVCPQSLFKFHPQFDTVLGELLRRDPQGCLVLINDQAGGNWQKLLLERFSQVFPDVVERVLFVPKMPREKFLGLLLLADALIDIPTFSGGNSSLEALSMGVPIATWPQEFMRGRVTAAFYKQMGLSGLIATDAESYLQLALRLAQDADFKSQMQADIKANIDTLFERLETVQEMENFFIAAFEAWRTGGVLKNSSTGEWSASRIEGTSSP